MVGENEVARETERGGGGRRNVEKEEKQEGSGEMRAHGVRSTWGSWGRMKRETQEEKILSSNVH